MFSSFEKGGACPFPFLLNSVIMKEAAFNIYSVNQSIINGILIDYGYEATFDGLMKAIRDRGDRFLAYLYDNISAHFSNAEGSFWEKFKSIFHKAAGIVDTADKIGGGVDGLINADKKIPTDQAEVLPESSKQKWSPNLWLWGFIALGVIALLIAIYFLIPHES